MTAKELLDAGKLSAAIEQLNADVKTRPTDLRARTFLFELLCFAGDYQRAGRQLDVIAQQDVNSDIGAQVYRNALTAEQSRQRVFTDGVQPHFLLDPPAYARLHLEAISRLREARPSEAEALLQEAAEHYPVLMGKINDEPLDDWRDADEVIGPFLELFAHDQYVWLPFEQIKQLHIAPPQRLRDLLWLPVTIEGWQGPIGEGMLPVLYVGSSAQDNEQIKLGRMTDWESPTQGPVRGLGQRMFVFGKRDRAILEVRELEFSAPRALV